MPTEVSREASNAVGGSVRSWARSAMSFVLRTYASADPRSLGAFRIALGALLIFDVARRIPQYEEFYTNAGWLTNHFALFRPMSSHLFSIHHAFSTPEEVGVLFGLHLLVNLLLLVGYKTRLMSVLAALLITSLNSRSIIVENGGYVVLNLVTVWSMFLPLGARFSVDALLASLKAHRERSLDELNQPLPPPPTSPVVSLAVTALILQWAVIYFFNTVHKNGPSWRDGTALYYFFEQDRIINWLGGWVRERVSLRTLQLMTWSTLLVEGSIPVLLLVPIWTRHTRKIAWILAVGLHLSIAAVATLGPFSWVMMVAFFAFVDARDWDWLADRLRRRCQPRELTLDPTRGRHLLVARLLRRVDPFGLLKFSEPAAQARERKKLSVAMGDERVYGARALYAATDALPVPSPLAASIMQPGIRNLVERWLSAESKAPDPLTRAELRKEPSPASKALAGFFRACSESSVLLLLIATGSQVLIENRAVAERFKPPARPEWMTALVVYPRLFQGWSMFAPDPPREDGRLVVDGTTVDNRKLDPLTGREPSFDINPPRGFQMDALWQAFHTRFAEPRFQVYWPGFRDFLFHHHELTHRPQDRLIAFDVYYAWEIVPPPGNPKEPAQRRKLFSSRDFM